MHFCTVFLLTVAFYNVSAAFGDGRDTELEMERTRRILLEDNYYTIVSKMDSLTVRMSDLESKHKAEVANLTVRMSDLENKHKAEVADLTNKIATLSRGTVAFKAHLTRSFTPYHSQLIEFDDVRFNLGHAYHAGTFIAPYSGTYLFSVAICSHLGHWVAVNLMRNGAMIGQVLAGDGTSDNCNSETTITELNATDDVSVHFANSGDSIQGSSIHLNSFTGVLLSVRM